MNPLGRLSSIEPSGRRLVTGRLCLELVSTVHGRLGERPRDDLEDRAGLADWLSGLGIASPATASEFDGFQSVREAVYRLASGEATGTPLPASQRNRDVALINELAGGEVPVPRMRIRKAQLVPDVATPTAKQVLALVARDAIDLLTGPDRELLCQCEAETCGTLYVDSSRGHSRRWCSSESCGNRARVAAHRRRIPST